MSGGLDTVLDAIQRNADTSARLLAAAEALRQAQEVPAAPAPANGGSATITVNMGGWGVAIAVCAALFCLLLVIDMRSDMRDTRRQVERTQDYTNMLWQRYPELRPDNLEADEK